MTVVRFYWQDFLCRVTTAVYKSSHWKINQFSFKKISPFCGAIDAPILSLDEICHRFQSWVDHLTICIPFRHKMHSSDSPMARHPTDLSGTRMTHPSHSWGFLLKKNYEVLRYKRYKNWNKWKSHDGWSTVTFNCTLGFNFLFQIFRSIKFLTTSIRYLEN